MVGLLFAPFPPGGMRIGVDSTVLALKTLFDAEGGLRASTPCSELRLDGQRLGGRSPTGRSLFARGPADSP